MIINPINGQRQSLFSDMGRSILKNYIENYKNGGMKRKISEDPTSHLSPYEIARAANIARNKEEMDKFNFKSLTSKYKKKKRKTKCGNCGEVGHNKRICPVKDTEIAPLRRSTRKSEPRNRLTSTELGSFSTSVEAPTYTPPQSV